MQNEKYINLSKFLCLVLRHKPEEIDLHVDHEGWANIEELLEKVSKRYSINKHILLDIVNNDNKGRYELSYDLKYIRCVHGHSIPINLNYIPMMPPEFLYHGTATKFKKDIEKYGICKKARQYVHLSEFKEDAINVGKRHGDLLLYKINALKMYNEGFVFYKSSSGIWLTDTVPSKYIHEIKEE